MKHLIALLMLLGFVIGIGNAIQIQGTPSTTGDPPANIVSAKNSKKSQSLEKKLLASAKKFRQAKEKLEQMDSAIRYQTQTTGKYPEAAVNELARYGQNEYSPAAQEFMDLSNTYLQKYGYEGLRKLAAKHHFLDLLNM